MTVINSHIITFEAIELVTAKSIFNWPVAFKLEAIDTTFDVIRFEIAALALVACVLVLFVEVHASSG